MRSVATHYGEDRYLAPEMQGMEELIARGRLDEFLVLPLEHAF